MEKINLSRQVFDKKKFNETIDTTFSQLGAQPIDPSFFDINLATQEDFWTLYDKFFFEIPKEGDTNSHAYLVQESSNYLGSQIVNEEIQALIGEISDLREENLELLKQNTELIKQQYSPSDLKAKSSSFKLQN